MRGVYGLINRAKGMVRCRVTGAEPAAFLNRCAAAEIPMLSVSAAEQSCVELVVREADRKRAEHLAVRSGCDFRILSVTGGSTWRSRVRRRALPILLALVLLAALAASRLFIWEAEAQGNVTVSSAKILAALEACGVGCGSFWPAFTSDNLRSELLTQLPELAWATVNIRGSRAEVIVRERVPKPELFAEDEPVDLVSSHAGFVTEILALRGTAQVQVGSAVLPGEVLIAGVAESAFSGTRTAHALGTVRAETFYEFSAVVPAEQTVSTADKTQKTRWALLIGKNRVNFYGNSSICPTDCDKINHVWSLKADGLFSLPVSLLREQYVLRGTEVQRRDESAACREMEQMLHDRLLSAIGADGVIENETFSRCRTGDTVTVCLRARCSENIAAEQKRLQEEVP